MEDPMALYFEHAASIRMHSVTFCLFAVIDGGPSVTMYIWGRRTVF